MGMSVKPHPAGVTAPRVEAVQPAFADMSAVVCTRDRTAQLERALDSLLDQELPAAEILVVDNAPSDNSTRLLVECRFPDVRYIREPVPGVIFARNRALLESRQTIVAFLDDDAVADPGWIRSIYETFLEHPQAAVCTGRIDALSLETEAQQMFEANGGLFAHGNERMRLPADARRHVWWRYAPPIVWTVNVGSGCNLAVRRAIALRLGGFDELLPGGEDVDLLWRTLEAGYQIVYEPEALAWHEHRRELVAAFDQIVSHQRGLIAVLTKAAKRSRGARRLPVLGFLCWRLVKPGVRLLRRVGGRDPLPAKLLLRMWWNCWRGLGAYAHARQLATGRQKAHTVGIPEIIDTEAGSTSTSGGSS